MKDGVVPAQAGTPGKGSAGPPGVPATTGTTPTFTHSLTALPEHIDELGHVNNAVWVQWIQTVATTHWYATAPEQYRDSFVWVVIRHEIDYLRPALVGDTVTARTWVGEAPKGARFDRFMEFTGANGKPLVKARTTWAMLDKATGRPQRITTEIVAPFLATAA